MPYKYKHADRYESIEDIRREYEKPYGRSGQLAGTYNPIRLERENAARARQTFLEELEFQDQMAARPYSLTVDLRNKYEIMQAIDMLQAALKRIENEVFEVPYDPSGMYF